MHDGGLSWRMRVNNKGTLPLYGEGFCVFLVFFVQYHKSCYTKTFSTKIALLKNKFRAGLSGKQQNYFYNLTILSLFHKMTDI
jgi:hypothetical protein